MDFIRFLLKKIVIVEVMLIILLIAYHFFELNIPIVALIIETGLKYLTPVAVVAFILYLIISILSMKIIEIALVIVLGGLILYYLISYVL